jgi:hypothetical protein
MSGGWLTLWTTVLWTALVLFSCLTVAVTIGGFIDIRKMIRQIRQQHRDAPTPEDTARGFEPILRKDPDSRL